MESNRVRITSGPESREELESIRDTRRKCIFVTDKGEFEATITGLSSGMGGAIGGLLIKMLHEGKEYEGHYNYVHRKGELQPA